MFLSPSNTKHSFLIRFVCLSRALLSHLTAIQLFLAERQKTQARNSHKRPAFILRLSIESRSTEHCSEEGAPFGSHHSNRPFGTANSIQSKALKSTGENVPLSYCAYRLKVDQFSFLFKFWSKSFLFLFKLCQKRAPFSSHHSNRPLGTASSIQLELSLIHFCCNAFLTHKN